MMVETPNLDCMDLADLHAYLMDESNHPLLRDYAACKARATECRCVGRIADAEKFESAADYDYEQLPDALKW